MPEKFKNKYRIPSARLQSWDYGSNAAYFITICTGKREHFFGNIKLDKGGIQRIHTLSPIGKIVEDEWLKTPQIRPDMNLQLGEFIVMPNHFHGIIFIGKNEYNSKSQLKLGNYPGSTDAMHRVSTDAPRNKFAPQSKNLGSIMRGFKSSVTMKARQIDSGFSWQSRFHDRIIRDELAMKRISEYIINNPQKWKEDSFYRKS